VQYISGGMAFPLDVSGLVSHASFCRGSNTEKELKKIY
jgi:hypothetical protein